jgi:hypothetical protein
MPRRRPIPHHRFSEHHVILGLEILSVWLGLGLLACAAGLPAFFKCRFARHDHWMREARPRI